MSSDFWYLAATNDEFELTLFCGDTYDEVDKWLRAMGDCTSKESLLKSKSGIVETDKHLYKVMRINKYSGKVLVGKIPPKKNHGKRKRKR